MKARGGILIDSRRDLNGAADEVGPSSEDRRAFMKGDLMSSACPEIPPLMYFWHLLDGLAIGGGGRCVHDLPDLVKTVGENSTGEQKTKGSNFASSVL